MRSSRVTPFLLSTLLCGALVAAGMGEGRLGMANDLESPAVLAPDQIEPEPPPRLSADLPDEIDGFDNRAEDYYCYGYEYAAQQESSEDDVDATDDCEEDYAYEDEYSYDGYAWNDEDEELAEEPATSNDDELAHDQEANSYQDEESYSYDEKLNSYDDTEEYAYDSEEFISDEPREETDVQDHDSYDYSEWDSEYGSQDYDDYEYAAEETQDVAPQTADDTSDGEFSYDYENEYMGEENDSNTHEAVQSDVEDGIEEIQEDGFSYEYDNYDSRYGYGYMEKDVEPVEAAELDAETEETEPSSDYGNWEDEYQSESKNESESENESYDHTTEYDKYGEYTYQPETEDVQADETESDSQLEQHGSWDSEYDESAEWESEYGDHTHESEIENVEADETETDSQFEEYGSWDSEDDESAEWESEDDYYDNVDDEMESDTPAEDDLGVYGGYSDAYPEEEHAYPEPKARDVTQEEPESSCDADEFGYDCYDARMDPSEELAQDDYWTEYGYEYSYPETKYGSAGATEEESNIESRLEGEPGEPTYAMEECPEEDLPCGVELFAWHPNELLSYQDQEILKTLQRLCEDPSGVRRATLNDYLEELGSDAVEFAGRFEDFSGIDVLGLADDLSSTAAFLASFRLLQRGELGIDEAVDVLRHSLDDLSLDWIEGVREITADAFDDRDAGIDQSEDESADWLDVTSTARPIVVAMVSIANRSISGAKSAVTTVSAQLADMELSTVLRQLSED